MRTIRSSSEELRVTRVDGVSSESAFAPQPIPPRAAENEKKKVKIPICVEEVLMLIDSMVEGIRWATRKDSSTERPGSMRSRCSPQDAMIARRFPSTMTEVLAAFRTVQLLVAVIGRLVLSWSLAEKLLRATNRRCSCTVVHSAGFSLASWRSLRFSAEALHPFRLISS